MIDPAAYDTMNTNVQNREALEFIPQLVAPMAWKSDQVVLDFGCGTGFVTKNILLPEIKNQMASTHQLKILAVDISKSAIEYADESHKHPDIAYQTMNLLSDDLSEFAEKIDKIFSCYAIHWIPETTKALQKLYGMLKPGGEIALYSPDMNSLDLQTTQRDPEFGPLLHVFADVPAYAEEFNRVGFEVLDSKMLIRPTFFDSKEHLTEMTISVSLVRVPPGKENKYRTFAAEAFKNWYTPAPTPTSEERIRLNLPFTVIRARKPE